MRLKNKLIIISLLFVFFVIFNNSDCFASVTLTSYYNQTMSFPDYSNLLTSEKPVGIIARSFSSYYLYVTSYSEEVVSGKPVVSPLFRDPQSSYFNFFYYGVSDIYTLQNNQWVFSRSTDGGNAGGQWDLFTLNTNIYNRNYDLLYEYVNLDPPSTKHDLFELNLTDKNFNDELHTFLLNSDENMSNYDEITGFLENENSFCIYLTDYTRFVTFDEASFYANVVDAHYLLSGYIDFLISDNAYFYYSPHYNRVRVCSGDYRGENMTTYTRRYFFNLVYSEDSFGDYFTILPDNGLLWNVNDYVNDGNNSTSDILQDISNSYFVGSNQSIYYANEDSNYILDSLSDSIYYGKNVDSDNRVFNFGFSGGSYKPIYLSELEEPIIFEMYNDEIEENSPAVDEGFNPILIEDRSNGGSSIIPEDESTYTYPINTVTDETDPQDDANHVENERFPFISSDTVDDTSNWSIWDFLKGIFDTIGNLVSNLVDAFIKLFVPSGDFFSNIFSDTGDWFELKLGFIFYPFEFFMDVFDRIVNIEFGEPIISIPDINEPFSDEILIHAVEFNFNSLLEDERINTAHNYYLMFVDAILIIGFINLLKNKFEEVTRR